MLICNLQQAFTVRHSVGFCYPSVRLWNTHTKKKIEVETRIHSRIEMRSIVYPALPHIKQNLRWFTWLSFYVFMSFFAQWRVRMKNSCFFCFWPTSKFHFLFLKRHSHSQLLRLLLLLWMCLYWRQNHQPLSNSCRHTHTSTHNYELLLCIYKM